MTTMLQTLDETAVAYTYETRATASTGGRCRYFVNDKCCAVGRCLENPVEFQDAQCSVTTLNDDYVSLEAILKPEYRGFPLAFWIALQSLHDLGINWDANGLSVVGRIAFYDIKRKFNL